ncbi:MAG TPA: hypothetical protein VLE91_01570 [Candidatus Saccharimonadales bacterium]|nr:hypothetical protein [Candidatus Saccharimonadales bacterium]
MKSSKSGFAAIIVLVVIIAVIGGLFLLKKYKPVPPNLLSSSPSSSPSSSSDMSQSNDSKYLDAKQTLSYILPVGWKDVSRSDDPTQISLASSDYGLNNDAPGFHGDLFAIRVFENSPRMTAESIMVGLLRTAFQQETPKYEYLRVGNKNGYYSHVIWEGENYQYVVANDNHYWEIGFSCGGGLCSDKSVQNRDYIIKNLNFIK